jgi:hypothetical protein
MRALKALVAVLTILLLLGFAGLIWGIVRQADKLAEPPEKLEQSPLSAAPAVGNDYAPWQALALDQPPGTRVLSVNSAGDLVLLHVATGEERRDERILVIDPSSGVLLGTITVHAKP